MTIRNLQRILWLGMAAMTLWWFVDYTQKIFWPSPVQDFALFYAASYRVLEGQAVLVYDTTAHVALQSEMFNIKAGYGLGFFYPPPALLVVAPLALISFGTAFFAFLLTGLALFSTLLRRITGDWIVALSMATSIGAPTQNIYFNHTGFITASLLGGGLLALKHSKAAAGMSLGLLCLKPHLAAVAMLMLLVWREWRALGFAVATVMLMAFVATMAFGWDIWSAYLQAGNDFQEILKVKYPLKLHYMLQSVVVMLQPWVGWKIAGIVHVVVALAALAVVVSLRQREMQIAAAICATALLSPFLFLYDTMMLLVAAALIVRAEPRFTLPAVGAMLVSGSWYLFGGSLAPISAITLLAMAWMIDRKIGQTVSFALR